VKRGRLGIIRDMLRASKGGVRKTKIMYEANLSFGQLKKYLPLLEREDLIKNKRGNDGGIRYKTSKKGEIFLKEYEKLEALINLNDSD